MFGAGKKSTAPVNLTHVLFGILNISWKPSGNQSILWEFFRQRYWRLTFVLGCNGHIVYSVLELFLFGI